uniref:hypothetical protein n=1 Tax=Treponema endosymbiont of Eucomonympha sp. TaxID=1580831 RepID=UPI000AB54CEF
SSGGIYSYKVAGFNRHGDDRAIDIGDYSDVVTVAIHDQPEPLSPGADWTEKTAQIGGVQYFTVPLSGGAYYVQWRDENSVSNSGPVSVELFWKDGIVLETAESSESASWKQESGNRAAFYPGTDGYLSLVRVRGESRVPLVLKLARAPGTEADSGAYKIR